MITYSDRLDLAIRRASSAHGMNNQFRKGSHLPYIIHPFGVMLIASNSTSNEDVLIACLLHDVLEDVPSKIYSSTDLETDFGPHVLRIVQDVTKDPSIKDWRLSNQAYLKHLKTNALAESLIVCAADKIQNLSSILIDYKTVGDKLWDIFTTKNKMDQIWYYSAVFQVLKDRNCPKQLLDEYEIRLNKMVNLGK